LSKRFFADVRRTTADRLLGMQTRSVYDAAARTECILGAHPAGHMGRIKRTRLRLAAWLGVASLLVQAYLPVHFAIDIAEAADQVIWARVQAAQVGHSHSDGDASHSHAASSATHDHSEGDPHRCLICVGIAGSGPNHKYIGSWEPLPSAVAHQVDLPAPRVHAVALLAFDGAPPVGVRAVAYSPRGPPLPV
jgi:hypothetical protein